VTKPQDSSAQEVEIRRAPKMLPFLLTGAAVGVIIAFVLYFLIPVEDRSAANILGLLVVALGSLGLGIGIAVSIVLDVTTARRVKQVMASKEEK
jgi:hypothetical protein